MVFTAAPNTSYKNARKKQNTRRYTLKIKVSDVCWIGGRVLFAETLKRELSAKRHSFIYRANTSFYDNGTRSREPTLIRRTKY